MLHLSGTSRATICPTGVAKRAHRRRSAAAGPKEVDDSLC